MVTKINFKFQYCNYLFSDQNYTNQIITYTVKLKSMCLLSYLVKLIQYLKLAIVSCKITNL